MNNSSNVSIDKSDKNQTQNKDNSINIEKKSNTVIHNNGKNLS
jgi:hypothetical protein